MLKQSHGQLNFNSSIQNLSARPLEHQNGIIWYRTLTSHKPTAIRIRRHAIDNMPGLIPHVLRDLISKHPWFSPLGPDSSFKTSSRVQRTTFDIWNLEFSLKYHVSDLSVAKPTESETLNVHGPDRKDTKYQADATWPKMSWEITKCEVMLGVCYVEDWKNQFMYMISPPKKKRAFNIKNLMARHIYHLDGNEL